ncbi:hypothetical protein OC861_005300 [Tilletia horrida]|nr:hypothetical protein OC861_005300 [Tilletia horrida]
MGDIYQVFNLPPPPPPTFLSFYNGPDRARLPNFLDSADPVGAAKEYLHGQIMFVCINGIWAQVKVVTGLAGLILVAAMAVIVRRLLQRSLWFLRVKATERGPMVIPNAVMVFAAAEGLFAIIFLAMSRGPPTLFGIRIWLPKSIFVSLFWLSVPFMVLFSVLGVAVVGNNYREQGVDLYYDWLERYSNATTLTRPMLLELQDIWAHDLKAFYWLAIAMFVWFFWTVVLFFAYIFVSYRLLMPLRSQLSALRDRNERKMVMRTVGDNGEGTAVTGSDGTGIKSACYFDGPTSQIESIQLPLKTPRLCSLAANFAGGKMDNVEFEKGEEEDGVDEHWGVNVKDLQVDAPHTSFFPPVRPSAVVRPATDSETSEKYLRAAYKHFLFQAVTVTVAIVYFSELTIYLALTVYSYNERRILGEAIDTAFLQAMWGAIFFGSCVFISITLRTYEPMLVSLLQNAHANSNGDRQTSSAQKASKMLKMLNLRHHEPKHSLSFSQGTSTLMDSPSDPSNLPPMQVSKASEQMNAQRQSQDGQARSARRNLAFEGKQGQNIIPGPTGSSSDDGYLPTQPPPPRRRAVPDVHTLNEGQSNSLEPESPQIRTTIANARDEVQQPFFTYPLGLSFLESSSSLNDRSLREMPSLGNMDRRGSEFSQGGEYAGAQAGPERTGSRSALSSPEPRLNEDFVSGLRGASPTSEDEQVRAFRSAFVRDMFSAPRGAALPPPPRQSRRPSKTS